MSGPKHTPTYPDWVTKMVGDHYDRIGEGVEDKPHLSIADMILDGYRRGQRDTTELVEAATSFLSALDDYETHGGSAHEYTRLSSLQAVLRAALAKWKERQP